MRQRLRDRAAAPIAFVTAAIGRDELGLLVALGLLVWGLWPRFGREALLVPGVVLLWIFLPVRYGFVARQVVDKDRK